MRQATFALALCVLATPAWAVTASSLREDCKRYFDFCAGYIAAILDTADDERRPGMPKVCTNGALYDDLVDTVIAFLERHRDYGMAPARSQVIAALLEKYPCR